MNKLSQTLQEKYPHLEVSVLKLSEVKKDNESFRIDSEYFKKEYLENENRIKSTQIIKNFINTKIKNIKSLKLNKSFNYLQISDIDLNNGIEYSITEIDCKDIPDRATYVLQKNDICVSTVRPNRNAVALIKNPKRLVGTSGFAVLRLTSRDILPEVLYIFVKTDYFITKMMRANTASLYPAVLDSDIHKCKIPIFPMPFQLEIEKLVKDSHKALESSKALYKEAEALLYEALGLDSKNPLQSILHSHYESLPYHSKQNENSVDAKSNQIPNYTIATLKESFIKTGRLDAEYYQSKYEDIERFIKNYKGGYGIVSDFFTQNKNICDFSKPYYNYIEIGDINTSNGNINYNKIATNELPANAKIMVRKGDILISKVRPYRGAIGIVNVEKDNLIASGAFVVLQEKGSIKKEFLQVLLRTSVYKEWVLRYNVGTSYPVIKDEDILNLPIPLFDSTTQAQIATYIQKSFELRAEAKKLLESAKAEVESALNNANNGGG
ncbi:restriction endonuclease subunit S [uncultured Helicobacter sp.]|uniref:restriction endonuclease subunit S n=1 Tax=uncultured Helicobacter sp. TaxID=175537 RepID=UPI00374E6727